MNNNEQLAAIRQELLAFGDSIPPELLVPADVPQAAELVATDPYAFAIATCLDRGMKAEVIWTIPYYIKSDLGHLDPHRINKMSIDELAEMFARLPRRPRYVNAAPRTLHELTQIVVEKCGGDAFNLWKDKHSAEVKHTFRSVYGVGPGIANMAVLLIESTFRVRFSDLDRTEMDIKPDVHTVKVLYRLGVSDDETTDSAVAAARLLNPEFPGAVDGALWEIGRRFCFATNPKCPECPMAKICIKCLS